MRYANNLAPVNPFDWPLTSLVTQRLGHVIRYLSLNSKSLSIHIIIAKGKVAGYQVLHSILRQMS